MKALNALLRSEEALYINQFNQYGFEWVDLNHRDDCVLTYRRIGKEEGDDVLVVLNLNPVPKEQWEITVGRKYTTEIFSSDDEKFWGTGKYKNESIECEATDEKANRYKLKVKLPPLSGIVLK